MAAERYFGEYAKFYVDDKQGVADYMGANNLVGDPFSIEIHDEGDSYTAFLVNRFGHRAGHLEDRIIRRVQLAQAKGWETVAYLSFFAFTEGTDEEHPGYYWGEMAVMAYDLKIANEVGLYLKELSKRMADGARPQVDFGDKMVEQLVASGGTWFPGDTAPRQKLGKRTSLLKDHRTPNERMIEQSRKGNIGCYIAGWAFIIAIIAGVVSLLHSCGVF